MGEGVTEEWDEHCSSSTDDLGSSIQILFLVRAAGIEPTSTASETATLSIVLRPQGRNWFGNWETGLVVSSAKPGREAARGGYRVETAVVGRS
jgi:hypothetical protein